MLRAGFNARSSMRIIHSLPTSTLRGAILVTVAKKKAAIAEAAVLGRHELPKVAIEIVRTSHEDFSYDSGCYTESCTV